ncbi:MAG: hypothetical protein QOC85_1764 [Streptomyces sp.]|jgi:hypothetical protein|nr:hypothetical protein [Streptomyces sp.]
MPTALHDSSALVVAYFAQGPNRLDGRTTDISASYRDMPIIYIMTGLTS